MPPSSTTDPRTDGSTCTLCGLQSICDSLGVISYAVPVEHPDFGKIFRCPNYPVDQDDERQQRMRRLSNLEAFANKTFENFSVQLPMLDQGEQMSLELAYKEAFAFANHPEGWLLLEGPYGCGKTHLAAAIGNERLKFGNLVLFLTAPDLLDHLRSTYGPSSEIGYDELFDRLRQAELLILDDLGAENPSQWAGEKLFQLLNYRYSHRLPTVITTNIDLDNLDGRIRSRLLDEGMIRRARITAPDYRTPVGNQQEQLTNAQHYRKLTLETFNTQRGTTPAEQRRLEEVLHLARQYADDPRGWLTIIGPYGSGKTHLAAGIANHYRDHHGQTAVFTTTTDLMDFLRLTFTDSVTVSLQRRFQTVLDAPLLILDDLGSEHASAWAREKLFQVIEYRYMGELPTVITSAKPIEEIDERIRTRLMDKRRCMIFTIEARPYAERTHERR